MVIFIITILTLSKNFSRGAPSSPQAAMAIPSSYTARCKFLTDASALSSPTCNNTEHYEAEKVGIVAPSLLVVPGLFVAWVHCEVGFGIHFLKYRDDII